MRGAPLSTTRLRGRAAVAYNAPEAVGGESMAECSTCGVTEEGGYLTKCPICHKMVCEDHKMMRSGRAFCSTFCADSFFYDDDDEGEVE